MFVKGIDTLTRYARTRSSANAILLRAALESSSLGDAWPWAAPMSGARTACRIGTTWPSRAGHRTTSPSLSGGVAAGNAPVACPHGK